MAQRRGAAPPLTRSPPGPTVVRTRLGDSGRGRRAGDGAAFEPAGSGEVLPAWALPVLAQRRSRNVNSLNDTWRGVGARRHPAPCWAFTDLESTAEKVAEPGLSSLLPHCDPPARLRASSSRRLLLKHPRVQIPAGPSTCERTEPGPEEQLRGERGNAAGEVPQRSQGQTLLPAGSSNPKLLGRRERLSWPDGVGGIYFQAASPHMPGWGDLQSRGLGFTLCISERAAAMSPALPARVRARGSSEKGKVPRPAGGIVRRRFSRILERGTA